MSARSSGLAGYRALPRIAGWGFLAATTLGRLPMSMVPLAILTFATSATGSLAVGGLAASAAAIGEAVGAPIAGNLTDRLGQRPVLLVGVVVHLTILVSFTLGAGAVPDAVTVTLAAATGLTLPQVGALSRARWLAMAPDDTPAAFAFEGVVDEIVYIIGPAVVGILAVVFAPQVALLTAAVLIGVFVTQFALHRTHALVPHRRSSGRPPARPRGSSPLGVFAVLLGGTICMGMFFGGSQTALTAFAGEHGIPDAGALLYAVMAVGSAVTTVAMVLVPERVGPWTRWILAASGLFIGALLLFTAPSIPIVIVAGLVAGAFQGPLLLTVFSIAGDATAAGTAGTMMTVIASGVLIGIATGSGVAGVLAQTAGSTAAFGVVVLATGTLLILGLATGTRMRFVRRRQVSESSPA